MSEKSWPCSKALLVLRHQPTFERHVQHRRCQATGQHAELECVKSSKVAGLGAYSVKQNTQDTQDTQGEKTMNTGTRFKALGTRNNERLQKHKTKDEER